MFFKKLKNKRIFRIWKIFFKKKNLNLLLVSRSDVRNRPASFLLDAFLVVVSQEIEKAGESLIIDDILKRKKKGLI